MFKCRNGLDDQMTQCANDEINPQILDLNI